MTDLENALETVKERALDLAGMEVALYKAQAARDGALYRVGQALQQVRDLCNPEQT